MMDDSLSPKTLQRLCCMGDCTDNISPRVGPCPRSVVYLATEYIVEIDSIMGCNEGSKKAFNHHRHPHPRRVRSWA